MILILLILIPLAGGILAWLINRWTPALSRWASLVAMTADLVLVSAFWAIHYRTGFLEKLGGIIAPLGVLITILGALLLAVPGFFAVNVIEIIFPCLLFLICLLLTRIIWKKEDRRKSCWVEEKLIIWHPAVDDVGTTPAAVEVPGNVPAPG